MLAVRFRMIKVEVCVDYDRNGLGMLQNFREITGVALVCSPRNESSAIEWLEMAFSVPLRKGWRVPGKQYGNQNSSRRRFQDFTGPTAINEFV